ncbi:SDR family oxidoreductase [Verrucomicrobiaceae bacterium R5-34]|nr:SDR family oxidoreductase [Verrucomicrobiaceae bacterium R5-34]
MSIAANCTMMFTQRTLSTSSILILSLLVLFGSMSSIWAEEAEPASHKNSRVLITGANRGLGLEMAKQFVAKGYQVIGTARKPEQAVALKQTGATVMKLDVTSEADIAALAKALEGEKIDILINNAGYFGPKLMTENPENLAKLTRQEMELCYRVNTLGPLFVTQALLPNLKLAEDAKVVHISTRASILSKGTSGTAYGYRVSKTALNMVTRTMSGDQAMKGILVVAIAPGHNKTHMGTERGKLDPQQSMAQVIDLIENLTRKHHGGLWYYDGSRLPW